MDRITIVALGFGVAVTTLVGLVVAAANWPRRVQAWLGAFSAGILVYLVAEALGELGETVVDQIHPNDELRAGGIVLALVGGAVIVAAVAAMAAANRRQDSATGTTWMIAAALGAHNFTEGLVIAQAAEAGVVDLAWLLAVGFAVHNFTEAFALVAPWAGSPRRPHARLLLGAGALAAGPAIAGAALGTTLSGPGALVVAMALAVGTVLYVSVQVIGGALRQLSTQAVAMGLSVGVLVGLGGAVALEVAGA